MYPGTGIDGSRPLVWSQGHQHVIRALFADRADRIAHVYIPCMQFLSCRMSVALYVAGGDLCEVF